MEKQKVNFIKQNSYWVTMPLCYTEFRQREKQYKG